MLNREAKTIKPQTQTNPYSPQQPLKHVAGSGYGPMANDFAVQTKVLIGSPVSSRKRSTTVDRGARGLPAGASKAHAHA